MTINLSRHAGGGRGYNPPAMVFDNGSFNIRASLGTVTSNKFTCVLTWQRSTLPVAGEYVVHFWCTTWYKMALYLQTTGDITLFVRNSAGTLIYQETMLDVCDGERHFIKVAFDGDLGLGEYIGISENGFDVVSPIVSPVAGTLPSTGSYLALGSDSGSTAELTGGAIGYFGWSNTYVPGWEQFCNAKGDLIEPDETNWSQWGGVQPYIWNEFAMLQMNKGSSTANFANTGSPERGLTDFQLAPTLGLPTIGDAVASDIYFGKTAWVNGLKIVGTKVYNPGMMLFATGTYYKQSLAMGTTKRTLILRFNRSTGLGAVEYMVQTWNPLGSPSVTMATDGTISFFMQNTADVSICKLFSINAYDDEEDHILFISFNSSTGVAMFYIDGLNADDVSNPSRVAPTTGTMNGGGSDHFYLASASATASQPFLGKLGFVGFSSQVALTNPEDFMDGNIPKQIDTELWTEFGGVQPEIWSTFGKLDTANQGSVGNLTKYGTVTGPI